MKCAKCGCSVSEHPLMRMNETGIDAIWWCEPCAKKYEPELYRNLKEDESDVEEDLKKIFYPKLNQ